MTTDSPEWSYAGATGPDRWASLAEAYAPCGGRMQSPIDIAAHVEGGAGPLAFSYAVPAEAARTSHGFVYVDYPSGNTLTSGGREYELKSAHAHAPSEHTIAGEQFAAELHLVHADDGGALAVVGVLFALGDASPVLQAMLDAAPPDGETAEGVAIDPGAYAPGDTAHFRYDGSLTTPPCSEGIAWHVLREVRTVSREQVDALLAIGGGPTNRPVQPLGDRVVTLEAAS